MATKSLSPPNDDEDEYEMVGKFILELYHRQLISPRNDWSVSKKLLRSEFRDFVNREENLLLTTKFMVVNKACDIFLALFRTHFIISRTRDSEYFRIRFVELLKYRNKRLRENDHQRMNKDLSAVLKDIEANDALTADDDKNTKKLYLEYQGTKIQARKTEYLSTKTGCCICQENFKKAEELAKHMEHHTDKSNFDFIKELKTMNQSIFRITYQFCKNSHNICFKLTTTKQTAVVEKIIVLQTHSLYYVHNKLVPFDLSKSKELIFNVDSHTFVRYMIHPFIIIASCKNKPQNRIVEEHHFLYAKEVRIIKNEENNWKYLSCKKLFRPKFNLPQYLPPAKMHSFPKEDYSVIEWMPMDIQRKFDAFIKNGKLLTVDNVRQVMRGLLQIEDIHVITEYSNLIQNNAKVRKFGDVYSVLLTIPRPEGKYVENLLSLNDDVLLIPETALKPTWDLLLKKTNFYIDAKQRKVKPIFGEIERVSNGSVIFTCQHALPEHQAYTIIFRPSRLVMRYEYYALELFAHMSQENVKRFLFPDVVMPKALPTLDMILHNTHIAQNPEQLQAVRNIVSGPRKEATYIIFGPPGTGKTITIVEAILQLYRLRPYTKILVTSSSNGACDEIATRLCTALAPFGDRHAIVRIYSRAAERRWEHIDDLLLEHSNLYGEHFYPDVQVIHNYRIVLCTLSVVGKLSTGWFGKNETGADIFTHVFIDEAAAAIEAETYMAIMCTLSKTSSLIISGDHKQLGAFLHSKRAEELGLGLSLLERLLSRECYRLDEGGDYDRTIQTRLCRNYRSHPEIVNLYNTLYYDNTLIAAAKSDVKTLCKMWHRSTNTDYPIIFHSVFGTAIRESASMSLCNPRELEVVLDYVMDLMYFGIQGHKITESDIGIISPYKKQCSRIQEELNLRKWYQIDTGSVEAFQGKEKSIIIVSFVRSFRSTLGFLENTRRLNVTLSRAKSLIILIGNPRTLSLNADFKYIIDECRRHNTLVGSTFFDVSHPPVVQPNIQFISKIKLNQEKSENDRKMYKNGNSDWRNIEKSDDNDAFELISAQAHYTINYNTMSGVYPISQEPFDQQQQQQQRIPQFIGCEPPWPSQEKVHGNLSDDSTSTGSSLNSKPYSHEVDQYQILPQLAAIYSPSNILKFNSSIYSIQVPTLRPQYHFSMPIFALSDSESNQN